MKRISRQDIVGEQGINLVQRVVLDMGFLWYATGLEAGIDGFIEIRDPETGVVSNCMVAVQSKATTSFKGETAETVVYYCDRDDLDYWLGGTTPVILVHSNVATGEAYWVDIKSYFSARDRRASGKILFEKDRRRFDKSARTSMIEIAVPADSGLYLSPVPKGETLETNLLHVRDFPETYFTAPTGLTDDRSFGRALGSLGFKGPHAWLIRSGQLISMYDPRHHPWRELCESNASEELPLKDWAFSEDTDEKNGFVTLMNRALRDTLYASQVGYDRSLKHFYFWSSEDLKDRTISFQSRNRTSTRTVFKAYSSKRNPQHISYCRHYAFEGGLVRYGDRWYLTIEPTYRFTRADGRTLHPKSASLLTGIKKLDGALAVANVVVMWASFLGRTNLFANNETLLGFGDLATVDLLVGIDDDAWLTGEDDTARLTSGADPVLEL